jgi:hypothetical protein
VAAVNRRTRTRRAGRSKLAAADASFPLAMPLGPSFFRACGVVRAVIDVRSTTTRPLPLTNACRRLEALVWMKKGQTKKNKNRRAPHECIDRHTKQNHPASHRDNNRSIAIASFLCLDSPGWAWADASGSDTPPSPELLSFRRDERHRVSSD